MTDEARAPHEITDEDLIVLHRKIAEAIAGVNIDDQITALAMHTLDLAKQTRFPLVPLACGIIHMISDLDGQRPMVVLSAVARHFSEGQLAAKDPDAEKIARDKAIVYAALERPTVQRRAKPETRVATRRLRRPRG